MSEISQFVSWGDQPPIERLSRSQLERIATTKEVRYPSDATKSQLIQILAANEIDVMDPSCGIEWRAVRGRDELGHDHVEYFPVRPQGKSATSGVDVDAVLQQKLNDRQEELKEMSAKDQRIEKLEEQNEKLQHSVDSLTQKLEHMLSAITVPQDVLAPSYDMMSFADLRKEAQARGINTFQIGRKQLIEVLVNGQQDPA